MGLKAATVMNLSMGISTVDPTSLEYVDPKVLLLTGLVNGISKKNWTGDQIDYCYRGISIMTYHEVIEALEIFISN